jgi:hypothetical protein
MSGWLFYRDVWPRLRPGQPPLYLIDLMDEAQAKEANIRWTILLRSKVKKTEEDIGYVETKVAHDPDHDTFKLHGSFKLRTPGGSGDPALEINSWYRVSREGELQEINAQVTARRTFWESWLPTYVPTSRLLSAVLPRNIPELEGRIWGEVREGKFFPHVSSKSPLGNLNVSLDPVPVSEPGNVLNPLQPLNRLHGLRKGQHWPIPRVDPLSTLPSAILPGRALDVEILEAAVTEDLFDLNGGSVPCFVIEYYRSQDVAARTWVRKSDRTVLQQEARSIFLDYDILLKRNIQP